MADEMNPRKFPPPLPPGSGGMPPRRVPPPLKPGSSSGVKPPPFPPKPVSVPPMRPPFSPQSPAESFSPRELEGKLKKMEDQSRDLEESKKKLERALTEMDLKLKEEKEKALTQAIKAREEEALSLKMEQALKEMQEKARRDRREQELEETRLRAEEKAKDLERRLNEEREAWVINLKKQMELRDTETRDVESQIESRFRDLERRWLEEKSTLIQALKSKEDEVANLKASFPDAQFQAQRAQEEANHLIEMARKKAEQELAAAKEETTREKKMLAERLDMRERELVALKAQLSMLDTQVKSAQDASVRNLQDKERVWQFQITGLQKDVDVIQQSKNQLQSDLTRANAEIVELRRTVNEWDKKHSAAEQRIQELKFNLMQAETRVQETSLKLQDEIRKKQQECETLERSFGAERQILLGKIEDRGEAERNLREILSRKESEMATIETKLRAEYQERIGRREKDIAELESQLSMLTSKLRNEFDAEKNAIHADHAEEIAEFKEAVENEKGVLLQWADRRLEEELAVKTELMQKELAQMREVIINDLVTLETHVSQDQQQYQDQIHKKEAELTDALHAIKELEKELIDLKKRSDHSDSQIKALREELESERHHLQSELAKAHEALESERREFEGKLIEVKSMSPTVQNDVAPEIEIKPVKTSILQKVWKYLGRTVVVVNLRPVPKIDRSSDQGR